MSTLKTYDRQYQLEDEEGCDQRVPLDWPFERADGCSNQRCCPLTPGDFITHPKLGGFGMVIAVNDEQLTVLWSEEPKSLSGFGNIAFPAVRRVQPALVANQLVSIQPMTLPSGLLFYMDYTYGCKTKGWWNSVSKRVRCTPSPLAFSSSWSRSRSTKQSSNAAKLAYETSVLDELITAGASLKERAARRLFGRTGGASDRAPRAVPEKPVPGG
jgi:hypothetical protein